jgi:hypothetical protein
MEHGFIIFERNYLQMEKRDLWVSFLTNKLFSLIKRGSGYIAINLFLQKLFILISFEYELLLLLLLLSLNKLFL